MMEDVIHDPARLLPATTGDRPELAMIPVGGFVPWSRQSPQETLALAARFQRAQVRRPGCRIPPRQPDLSWTEDGVHHAARQRPDGSFLIASNNWRQWEWSLVHESIMIDRAVKLKERGVVVYLVRRPLEMPTSFRWPLEWAVRAAASGTRRVRPVPEDAEATEDLAARVSGACLRSVHVRYEGWRRAERRCPGGLADLHRLVDEALYLAWQAWSWCPERLTVSFHEQFRYAGIALACTTPPTLNLSLRALEVCARRSMREVVLHELCHLYQVETDPALSFPKGVPEESHAAAVERMHGERFREALCRALPALACSDRIDRIIPAVLPSRVRRLLRQCRSWLSAIIARRKTQDLKRHGLCRPTVFVRPWPTGAARVSWSPARGVIVWRGSPGMARLTWQSVAGRPWCPRDLHGLVPATLLLASRFRRSEWPSVRVRQVGQHSTTVRTLEELVRHVVSSKGDGLLMMLDDLRYKDLLVRMEDGRLPVPAHSLPGSP